MSSSDRPTPTIPTSHNVAPVTSTAIATATVVRDVGALTRSDGVRRCPRARRWRRSRPNDCASRPSVLDLGRTPDICTLGRSPPTVSYARTQGWRAGGATAPPPHWGGAGEFAAGLIGALHARQTPPRTCGQIADGRQFDSSTGRRRSPTPPTRDWWSRSSRRVPHVAQERRASPALTAPHPGRERETPFYWRAGVGGSRSVCVTPRTYPATCAGSRLRIDSASARLQSAASETPKAARVGSERSSRVSRK